MTKYLNETIKKYLDDLSAKLPAPGGGSASAAVAAVGVGLLGMAANFTLEKKGYEACQDEIKKILEKLESARARLSELIDLDVEVYGKVSGVYRLPKNTDEEKLHREKQIQDTLKEAMKVPYEIVRICQDMIKAAHRLVDIGNKNLVSDVGCGVLFLSAAAKSAKLNVEINLKFINDTGFVNKVLSDIESITSGSLNIVDETVLKTEKKISPHTNC
jgi:formiminotetrahydrofolate cyclodeaminase